MYSEPAQNVDIIAIDFETTGKVKGYPDEPWQVGYVPMRDGKCIHSEAEDILLHIGDRPFNNYAPGRHSELRDELARAQPLQAYWKQVQNDFKGKILCAHNIATEKKVLNNTFPLNPFGPWIDTLKLSRLLFPELNNYKLETVIQHIGCEDTLKIHYPGRYYHDALFDAAASALILEYIFIKFENIPLDNLLNPEMMPYYQRRS